MPLIVTGAAVFMYSTTRIAFANVSWIGLINNKGPILDYTVRFGLTRDMLLNKYVANVNQYSIIIPGLEADTAFYFAVQGRTRAGYGPLSNIVFSPGISLSK